MDLGEMACGYCGCRYSCLCDWEVQTKMSEDEINAIKAELGAMKTSIGQGARIFMWVIGILVGINVSAIVWAGSTIVTHEYRITKVESNRFTDKDAVIMKDSILTMLPPEWLVNDVERNRMDIDHLKDGIRVTKP